MALVVAPGFTSGPPVHAHGVLVASSPSEGAGLIHSPTAIVLTFSEEPEPNLADIAVIDSTGAEIPLDAPTPVAGDPVSITARMPPVEDGVYTVSWRIVSRVDGHATAGAFAFGVGMTPDQAELDAAAESTQIRPSVVELVGRWIFLAGLLVAIGATIGAAAGFAGRRRGEPVLIGGLVACAAGLALLMRAQWVSAGTGFEEFFDTYAGGAILWRAGFLAAAAVVGLRACRSPDGRWPLRAGLAAVLLCGVAAVHVAAGHAAAAPSRRWIEMAAQWTHIVAAGAWLGGLLTLVIGLRGLDDSTGASKPRAFAVRRFAFVAAIGIVLVALAGTVRALDTLNSVSELIDTAYGRAVVVKIVVFMGLGVLGLVQRRRAVPQAATSTRLLERLARPELVLAVVAVIASGVLGSLSPPVTQTPLGFDLAASDSTGELGIHLETSTRLPGPNRFVVSLDEASTDHADDIDTVLLRFRPLDDPAVPATTLELEPTPDGTYEAAGTDLAFPGRWEISTTLQSDTRSWVVPIEVTTDSAPLFRTRVDLIGEPPEYTVQLPDNGFIWVSPRVDDDHLVVTFVNFARGERPVDRVVVTATDAQGRAMQLPVERTSSYTFDASYDIGDVPFTVGVVARDPNDDRLYATFDIDPTVEDR